MNPMLILGLLLVVLSGAAVALLVAYNASGGPEQMITLFGRDLVSVTPLQAFVAGIVLALIFCLGLWMVVAAERSRRATRSEYRAVRREARATAAERDRLAKELAREQERTTAAETTTTAAPAWTPPEQAPARTAGTPGETTETRGLGLGRHFRRTPRTTDARNEQPTNG
jgi:hypothetical protein